MSGITTCAWCGKLFEASSEEYANEPGRLCGECFDAELHPDNDVALPGDPILGVAS